MSTNSKVTFTLPEEKDVHFHLEIFSEESPIKGNVMSSGDEEADRKAEEWVRNQLKLGEYHAWCSVTVSAFWRNMEGKASIGCCSYETYEELYQDLFEKDSECLKKNAYEELLELLRALEE